MEGKGNGGLQSSLETRLLVTQGPPTRFQLSRFHFFSTLLPWTSLLVISLGKTSWPIAALYTMVDCQAPSSVLLTLNDQSASRPKKKNAQAKPAEVTIQFRAQYNVYVIYRKNLFVCLILAFFAPWSYNVIMTNNFSKKGRSRFLILLSFFTLFFVPQYNPCAGQR